MRITRSTLALIIPVALLSGTIGYFSASRTGSPSECQKCWHEPNDPFKYEITDPGQIQGSHLLKDSNAVPTCIHTCFDNTLDEVTTISADSAKRSVRRYGVWAGQSAVAIEKCRKLKDPIQFWAGWKIPLKELIFDLQGATHARAYLAIKDTNDKINGLPKLSLMLAIIENSGEDREAAAYHNLVRPCPTHCDTTSVLFREYIKGISEGRKRKR